MAKKLQILRGTTAQNDVYTGSVGELTMDTEKVEVRIHDGTTQGGKTIGSGGGASLPILTHVFSDHKLNDMSWLNADTFSWQSGDVYVAAYEHLAEEFASVTEWSYETVGGVYIGYKLMPDGHKITDVSSEQYVQAIYEATGVAWYYILDTVNKQFKLPRSKHNKYADTVPVVGTGKSIGFTPINKAFSGNNALYPNAAAIGGTNTVYQANTAAVLGLSTDPNRSQVFAQQAQDTDQYKYLYFYVGNFEQDAVEQTAGITAETLNSKLDIGAGNATNETKTTIVGWGMPDYSAGVVVADGYQTTFPCFITLIHPAVAASNSAVVINIDGVRVALNVAGGNVSKRLGTSCYVDAGHIITIDGSDGSPVLTVYPLKGVN